METETAIDLLYKEIKELELFLATESNASYYKFVDDNFRKYFLLASASFFEKEITRIIRKFAQEKSAENKELVAFVSNKAIKRQYHTFFNWKSKNANSFFGLFGADFIKHMKEMVKADIKLDDSIKAFLIIGSERNELVHQNFGAFTIEKTTDEIFEKHEKACYFIETFEEEIMKN